MNQNNYSFLWKGEESNFSVLFTDKLNLHLLLLIFSDNTFTDIIYRLGKSLMNFYFKNGTAGFVLEVKVYFCFVYFMLGPLIPSGISNWMDGCLDGTLTLSQENLAPN